MEKMNLKLTEEEYLSCCGSPKFGKLMMREMMTSSPESGWSLEEAVEAAREIWFNDVDVNSWLQAFSAHPQIGHLPPPSTSGSQWCKGEQSAAFATATASTLQELAEWNAKYKEKFGFVFLIFASGRTTPEILSELKKRYGNRPIVELEIAAKEQMKITELRLSKLFSTKLQAAGSGETQLPSSSVKKLQEDRVSIIGGHLSATSDTSQGRLSTAPARTRPPITTHVLDVSRGCPAGGIEVKLEMWKGLQPRPSFSETGLDSWELQGSSVTDSDGRSGQLMSIVNILKPGIYRISFNTGKYCPSGFFPYVSIVFEIRESQSLEHFHVPILLSPFSFTTYRGS